MSSLPLMSAYELSRLIKNGELSVREVCENYIDRARRLDGSLHAFNTLCPETALADADRIQKQISDAELDSPLAGVPVSVKDNLCTSGVLTTCSSKMLADYIPPYDAFAVKKLRENGMPILGKTNMDEFAMGSTTETSCTGAVKNPWNTAKTAGGSSGGSAACVAAMLSPVSLGTDTGGSIRQPSSFCGVTGLKPTYGAVSRYGLIAFASSLDTVGTIGRDAVDCAALFSIICGHDKKDGTSAKNFRFDFNKAVSKKTEKKRIGIPEEYLTGNISPEIKSAVLNAAKILSENGMEVDTFSFPVSDYAVSAYYIISSAEASSNLARYDGIRYGFRADSDSIDSLYIRTRSEGFGAEAKRRILLGNFVLSKGYYDAYYKKAVRAKQIIADKLEEVFSRFDVILAPVYPRTAPDLGENLSPAELYTADIYTVTANLAGLPALALPCGFDGEGMPLGVQLIGRRFSEAGLFNLGRGFQLITDYHKRIPEGGRP